MVRINQIFKFFLTYKFHKSQDLSLTIQMKILLLYIPCLSSAKTLAPRSTSVLTTSDNPFAAAM